MRRSRSSPGRAPALRPLVVDLDRTLIASDTLAEALVRIAFRHPARLPAVLAAGLSGRAALKHAAASAAELDYHALPYDNRVMALIEDRRREDGEVHLVTAADQRVADGVAAAMRVFDSATGSRDGVNLKGPAKAARLAAMFPLGFDYVGDSAADLPSWRLAQRAHVVAPSARLRRRLAELREFHTVPRPVATARTWASALRLHQLSKNLLLLVPLLLGQDYREPALLLTALAAVLLFGMIASATYLANDMADLRSDRLHPTKRTRALAAGLIPLAAAVPVAVALLVAGLAGSWWLSRAFGVAATAYVGLTLAYSLRLKREPLVDTAVIAGLFGIRVSAGTVVIGHPISLWLTSFAVTLFLSLALAKRTAELVKAARGGLDVNGRGYVRGDEGLTTALGVAFGALSVVVMVLYLSLDAMPANLYQSRGPLFLIPAVLGLWVMRIWLLAHRGTLDDDPVVFALTDRVSLCYAAATLGLWAAAVS